MAAEHGSSSIRVSSKRRQGDGGNEMSDTSGRFLSPARTREPAVGPAAPTVGESPTRFTGENMRAEAASPAAPSADMTITELTHAYQHLAAQLGLDRQWATHVESAITDHALWLDKRSRAGNTVAANLASLTEHVAKGASGEPPTNTTGASGANNDNAAESADAQLRAHVQAQDVAMCARLDAAEEALRGLITSHCAG